MEMYVGKEEESVLKEMKGLGSLPRIKILFWAPRYYIPFDLEYVLAFARIYRVTRKEVKRNIL